MIDKGSQIPLYKQLADELTKKINKGEYPPNTRMPTIRTLAAELDINNSTVVNAYKYLEKNQAVHSIRGSGIYVNSPKITPTMPITKQGYINFADTSVDPAFFPKKEFQEAFGAVIARDGAGAFSHTEGFAPLLEVISQMHDGAKNIQIISDVNHGLNAALDALINPGDAVILESPTSPAAMAAFLQRGAKILEVPVTENGLDTDKLTFYVKKFKPKIFFLMPTYQTPTNICYTDKIKTYILQLAHKFNAYIIEVDSYGDFYYKHKPTPLLAMDNNGRVLYIKTFERTFSTGMLGYMVCPNGLNFETGGASGYIQRGLDFYFRNFDYNMHCANIRAAYAKRYKTAVAAAETFLSPYCTVFSKSEGGLCLWLKLKNGDLPAGKVIVSPGQLYFSREQTQYFRISYANISQDDISKGIGILASLFAGKQKG
ncbi:MAG: PLP-dependent aminotransferase family protein [Defluviitaleaceae bacterium]|nr:PLP-dependent aminotransferase family protein [Defluviitaleaceae bacterium]